MGVGRKLWGSDLWRAQAGRRALPSSCEPGFLEVRHHPRRASVTSSHHSQDLSDLLRIIFSKLCICSCQSTENESFLCVLLLSPTNRTVLHRGAGCGGLLRSLGTPKAGTGATHHALVTLSRLGLVCLDVRPQPRPPNTLCCNDTRALGHTKPLVLMQHELRWF